VWRPLQATKVTSHLDYYLCFSLYSTVGHIGGSYVCYILCTKTLWYSNKVIESKYYAFHYYFIGDYRMGLPPRKGEAGKQPISSFKSKVIRISNSVWLTVCTMQLPNSAHQIPLDKRDIQTLHVYHNFSQITKSFNKSSGRSVCYSTESQVYEHQIQNLLPHFKIRSHQCPKKYLQCSIYSGRV